MQEDANLMVQTFVVSSLESLEEERGCHQKVERREKPSAILMIFMRENRCHPSYVIFHIVECNVRACFLTLGSSSFLMKLRGKEKSC